MLRAFRSLTCCGLLVAAGLTTAVSEASEPYPQKPIRFVIPFPAGGGTDVVARVLGKKMADDLGQPIVIDNRGGANTIIGADLVAKAPPDGYTVLVSIDNTWVMNQFLYDKLPYDPLKEFEPVAKIGIVPLFLIASSKGPKTMQDLIAKAQARPGQVTYGFGAITSQLCGEILKDVLKLNMLGVSYKGSAGVAQGLLSDDVDFAIDGLQTVRGHIASGKFQVLANMGKNVVPGFEKIPTVASISGDPGIDTAVWVGMTVPKGTPAAIIERLNKAAAEAVKTQEFKDTMTNSGLLPDYQSTREFRTFLNTEAQKWGPVITKANIKF